MSKNITIESIPVRCGVVQIMRSIVILNILLLFLTAFPLYLSVGSPIPTRQTGIDLVPTLVYDRVLEVPPGGETRVVISPMVGIRTEGYIGPSIDPDTKMGQATDLLPEWLRDDFINNMVETGSRVLFPSSQIIPAFGDLDADHRQRRISDLHSRGVG
ncbi:MAG: hypothetical protein ACMUFK_04925 [Thermoplasmatota archaeon]